MTGIQLWGLLGMTVMATGFLCVRPQHFMGIDVGFWMGCFVYDCGALLMAATFFVDVAGWLLLIWLWGLWLWGFLDIAAGLYGYACNILLYVWGSSWICLSGSWIIGDGCFDFWDTALGFLDTTARFLDMMIKLFRYEWGTAGTWLWGLWGFGCGPFVYECKALWISLLFVTARFFEYGWDLWNHVGLFVKGCGALGI